MGVDIAISWNNEIWRGDWSLAPDGTLATGNDMETAITLSLMTDRTALPDDVIPDGGSIRGYWADTYFRYPLGSRLWLLWREKQTLTTARRAAMYAHEALTWLVDCGAARKVETDAEWVATGVLEVRIWVTAPTGERRFWRYPLAWAGIGGIQ
jgi:phage gp46-like protein